jgi:hypothetical protein
MSQVSYFKDGNGSYSGGVEHRVYNKSRWQSRFSIWYDQHGMPTTANQYNKRHHEKEVTQAQWNWILRNCRMKFPAIS